MAASTGPVLVAGGLVMAADVLGKGRDVDLRVPVATAGAAAALSLFERSWKAGAVSVSYLMLVTVLFVRPRPNAEAPVEVLLGWWNAGGGNARTVSGAPAARPTTVQV